MKRLLLFAAVLITIGATAQQPVEQRLGAPYINSHYLGSIQADSVVYLPNRDTNFFPQHQAALIVRQADGNAYLWNGINWNVLGAAIWGRIKGNMANQTDLIDSLNNKQGVLSEGYGVKVRNDSLFLDTISVPIVHSVIRLTDSTLQIFVNGTYDTVLIRGTAAGGITSLTDTLPTALFAGPLVYTNTGGAWHATMVLAPQPANSFFAGPSSGSPSIPSFRVIAISDLPTGIPNANLLNPSIGLFMDNTGTAPAWAASSVSLGGSATIHIPYASPTTDGVLSAANFNKFNAGVTGAVLSVNGHVGNVVTLNADSIFNYPIDITNFRNGYVLAWDTVHSKLVFNSPFSGSGITSLNGLTGSTQTFGFGASGTSPGWSSSGTTHTLNIPLLNGADTGLVTPGLYNTWNAKEPAITAAGTVNKYWNGYKLFVPLNTDSIAQGSTNKFFATSDTAGLKNKVDSLKRAPGNDTVYYWAGGVKHFAFLDSVGLVGTCPTCYATMTQIDSATISLNRSNGTSDTLKFNVSTGGGGGGGGLSSVGLALTTPATAMFNVSNSPLTSNGNITLGLQTVSPYSVLAGGSSTSTPTFQKMVPLNFSASIPDVLMGWDDSGNPIIYSAGTNVTIHGGTISASGGGSTPPWESVLNVGSTMASNHTITNTGFNFTWDNGGTGTFKFNHILQDTANNFGPYTSGLDSTVKRMTWANAATKLTQFLPTITFNIKRGLNLSGLNIVEGNPLRIDSIVYKNSGNTNPFVYDSLGGTGGFYMKLLPSKTTALATDSVPLIDVSGKFWKFPVPSGGSGGGVTSVTATNTTLTISPTNGNVLAGINLANANTWTGAQIFSSALTSSGTTTISNTASTTQAACPKCVVAVFDSTTGIVKHETVVPAVSGTYTPTVTSGTNTTYSASSASGTYMVVGNIVYCQVSFGLSITTTNTNSIIVFSLPFTSSHSSGFQGPVVAQYSGTGVSSVGNAIMTSTTQATVGFYPTQANGSGYSVLASFMYSL